MVCWPILAGIPANKERKKMIEILNIIYTSNFLISFASFITIMFLIMIVINVYDYIKLMQPYWKIEKKYKELRKGIK